ncbi:MAG: Crp/Fnr family transcriptional regulator [Bacteroidales bacterium]|jgi:CRP-like cAMP-binding protein|nr:Crp/Fnr family transcriptional regulator [Bacteroidales bacterium]MDI9576096.1 Crp/Fnr family transcriptional regulator [Bacteroidota bacterium]MDY0400897.1 Crp/Fnr family transcriptional regulator [Bacteroidales bacterium]HHW59725.1 Crp/Fnr family transcriptional regulator [Bacteroidales bacterium]HQD58756.1 Crp/Fnr family transcriptional regulator [Bacteroidales bacterium]
MNTFTTNLQDKHSLRCNCEDCFINQIVSKHLAPIICDQLLKSKMEVKYSQGDTLVEEGEKINKFLYIKEGLIKVSQLTDKKENRIISIARPHDNITLLTFFSSEKYLYTITALEDTLACTFPYRLMLDVIKSEKEFSYGFLNMISYASSKVINNFIKLSSRNLRGRLAYIILNFSDNIYKTDSFDLPLSRKEIAELIGMTVENVIRILSEFKKDGIINIDGKSIDILDKKKLQMISEFG